MCGDDPNVRRTEKALTALVSQSAGQPWRCLNASLLPAESLNEIGLKGGILCLTAFQMILQQIPLSHRAHKAGRPSPLQPGNPAFVLPLRNSKEMPKSCPFNEAAMESSKPSPTKHSICGVPGNSKHLVWWCGKKLQRCFCESTKPNKQAAVSEGEPRWVTARSPAPVWPEGPDLFPDNLSCKPLIRSKFSRMILQHVQMSYPSAAVFLCRTTAETLIPRCCWTLDKPPPLYFCKRMKVISNIFLFE